MSGTEECVGCGDEIEGDGVYNNGSLTDAVGDALSDGESVPVGEIFEFDDGPYCSLDCSVSTDTDEAGDSDPEIRTDGGTVLSSAERHKRGKQAVAVYECHCGSSITFPERRWDGLRYIVGKLGYRNIDAFIDANRTCCNRPSYTSVCSVDADTDEAGGENPEIRTDGGMDRIDEDENATTGDTRIRIDTGERDTYVLRREKYGLVEFESCGDDAFERYDWHTDETFVLRGDSEAKQFAFMLSEEGAFDPNILFFRQRTYPGDNEETEESSTATDENSEIRTDGGIEIDGPARMLGPHRVPRIECGRCGHGHHIDATTGEYQGHCEECYGFLRRPTDEELGKFYAFMDWKARHVEAATDQPAEGRAE